MGFEAGPDCAEGPLHDAWQGLIDFTFHVIAAEIRPHHPGTHRFAGHERSPNQVADVDFSEAGECRQWLEQPGIQASGTRTVSASGPPPSAPGGAWGLRKGPRCSDGFMPGSDNFDHRSRHRQTGISYALQIRFTLTQHLRVWQIQSRPSATLRLRHRTTESGFSRRLCYGRPTDFSTTLKALSWCVKIQKKWTGRHEEICGGKLFLVEKGAARFNQARSSSGVKAWP